MLRVSRPSLALPEPLRAAEAPSFTHYSVVVRLPEIARRTLKENRFPPGSAARIQELIDEIPHGTVRQVSIPLAREAEDWATWILPYEGMNWLEIPWFFAEEYFYIRILEATGYFIEGPWRGVDPYAQQKRMGLESTREKLQVLAEQIDFALGRPADLLGDSLARLLLIALWGNQNDMSLWPVKRAVEGGAFSGGSAGSGNRTNGKNGSQSIMLVAAQEHLLANDLDPALSYLGGLDPASTRVDILLDNAGYELVADLALANFLLSSGRAARVVLHAKHYPVFVSDAADKDIHDTLDFLAFEGHQATQGLAVRLRSCLVDGRMVLRHHPFWTSPLPAWDMPDDLKEEMSESSLVISKGDANYRRLLGDRHWPMELPFSSVVDYFPCGLLALRTLKSEEAVGIPASAVPSSDPDWMVDGRWGVAQFAPPNP